VSTLHERLAACLIKYQGGNVTESSTFRFTESEWRVIIYDDPLNGPSVFETSRIQRYASYNCVVTYYDFDGF